MRWMLSLLFVLTSLSFGAECGADGEPRCEFTPATKTQASGCTPPAFLDIGKGQCWQCPDGYDRSLEPVDGPNACKRPVAAQRFAATKYGASGCQSGEFLDLTRNECWQCPTNYDRSLSAVTASDACTQTTALTDLSATKVSSVACQAGEFLDIGRNECWQCPDGYDRTLSAVTSGDACSRAIPERLGPAQSFGKGTGVFGTDCPSGAFLDIGLGTCWKCPDGSNRTGYRVDGDQACSYPGYTAISPATLKRSRTCPAGQIFDPLDGGGCWTCPEGSSRTVFAINSTSACEIPPRTLVSPATYKRPNPCPAGQFQDPIDGGTCWSCPTGTVRTLFPVNGNTACEIPATSINSAASFRHTFPCPSGQIYDALADGGSCWTCPANHNRSIWPITTDLACTIDAGLACDQGLVDIGGKCREEGKCGGNNQRPCTLLERVPSCDPGFYEEFSISKCLPILPGESPFLKGLNSLANNIFDVQAICEDVAQLLPKVKSGDLQLDGTAACVRGFGIGFSCAIPKYALDLSTVSDAADAIGNYYESAPCNVPYTEEFRPATRGGASRLLSCPAGQFFDLIDSGTCWSCPDGWSRTIFAVNTDKACMRGEGVPQLFRGLCAAGQVLTGKPLGDPMACVATMFKDGLPLEAGNPASLDATGALCRLAGEFTSEHVARIFSPLGTIEDPVVRRGRMIAELEAIQEGLDSKALVERISKEPACMGFLSPAKDTLPTSVAVSSRRGLLVSALPNGGLRIDLPPEVGAHGVLRRMDGSQVMTIRSPGISVAAGTLKSGVYLLTIAGAKGPTTIPVTVP